MHMLAMFVMSLIRLGGLGERNRKANSLVDRRAWCERCTVISNAKVQLDSSIEMEVTQVKRYACISVSRAITAVWRTPSSTF